MSALADAPEIQFDDRTSWRAWLQANHATARGVWLITWRAGAGRRGLAYADAVEEALCFGWVDSVAGRVDEARGKLYFAPRKPCSTWAASNKARVERLIREGHMRPAGLAAVARARENGSWDVLESVERLDVPPDLDDAFRAWPAAGARFAALTPSARKAHLASVALARRPETRAARIERIIAELGGGASRDRT